MSRHHHDLIDMIAVTFDKEPDLVLQCVDLIRRKLFGIILVNDPTKPTIYWDEHNYPISFSETSSQTPKCFASFHRAKKTALRLEQKFGQSWKIMLWIHPDCNLLPINKYRELRAKFPGSPTQ